MALQSVTNINVDFCDKKFILINAKQLDRGSRFLSVTCYDNGEIYHVNASEHSAYIRYKKTDDKSVFNFCDINQKGKIIVELTEQMLVSDGFCYADLVIVNKGNASVDRHTGEIVAIDNAAILSTMTFCIDVSETPVLNSEIESSYEFNGLNTALRKAEAEYTEVIQLSKSYAVGDTGGIRSNEDTDNSKYYYEQSRTNANNASISATNASTSASNAKTSETNANMSANRASASEIAAKTSETNAYNSEQNAKSHMNAANASETKSKNSENAAKSSEDNAKTSETNAKASEEKALISEQNAKTSETNALNYFNLSKSYAVGETGVRENEDFDNSKYYYGLVRSVVESINNAFVPMGTITFAELSSVEKVAGFVYNISDDFITDENFKEGSGKFYTAGTNVYCTADGFLDAFGGSSSPMATVNEVVEYLNLDV